MQDVAAKEPTCTEVGWKAYKRCEHYCGKTEGYEEIPATGHNLSITVPRVEPTCERWGNEEYLKCSNEGCDYHTDYNGLPALGHDTQWHDPYDATCTEDGYRGSYSTCNREGCDYSSKSDRYVDKALGHNLKHHEAMFLLRQHCYGNIVMATTAWLCLLSIPDIDGNPPHTPRRTDIRDICCKCVPYPQNLFRRALSSIRVGSRGIRAFLSLSRFRPICPQIPWD